MRAYYNEIDPFAAQWLRNLIAAGHIAPGDVDTRSIVDVSADDLKGYTQVHLFAGIGGWSRALRLAGVPDSAHVWTGSPPCQPFSVAGRRKGAADERHLWPENFRLIRECRPKRIFGEQVAAAIGLNWLDLVSDDLEATGYAVGAIVLPACSVGAPHIRQRLVFGAQRLGDSNDAGPQGRAVLRECANKFPAGARSMACRMAQPDGGECAGRPSTKECERNGAQARWEQGDCGTPGGCETSGLADTEHTQRRAVHEANSYAHGRNGLRRRGDVDGMARPSGPLDGFWQAADWLYCRDAKWRPVEPGTFPLAHGVPARVGRLRGYGNAIVPQVAAEVIRAFMEYAPE